MKVVPENKEPQKLNGTKSKLSSSSQSSNMSKIKYILDRRSYVSGVLVIRKSKAFKRRIRNIIVRFKEIGSDAFKAVVCSCKVFAVKNGIELDEVNDKYNRLMVESNTAKKQGTGSLIGYWTKSTASGLSSVLKKVVKSPNYLLPVMAASVFALSVSYVTGLNYALEVTYNNEFIGFIKDEAVFEEAQKQMEGRIIFEEYIRPEDSIPQFSIAVVKKNEVSNANQLTNNLIKASGNELTEAFGLYVDNRFVGAVSNRVIIDNALTNMLSSYRTDDLTEVVEFNKPIEVRGGLYPITSVSDGSTLEQEIRREEVSQRIYTAQKGDAPVLIAKKNNIPYSQLKALNPEIEKKLLIGQEVLVTQSVPMLGVKVTREMEYEESIPFQVNQIQDTSQYQGYVEVTQEGKKGENLVVAKVTYVDGVESNRQVVRTDVVSEPINEIVVVGGKKPVSNLPTLSNKQTSVTKNPSSNFIWPVDGGYVSCGINGYRGHTGMDIAAPSGTAVRASASGTVILVKNSTTGYGRHIIVDHGGGVQTLYAHNNILKVNVGQWVEQGQLIALVGRTGRATGNHLHFEVRINGRYQDPAKYIGTR